MSRRQGNATDTVDRQGQLDLVDAAEGAGVHHFVLVSFPPIDVEFPPQNAKRAVGERLRRGAMRYTIIQPTFFTESPAEHSHWRCGCEIIINPVHGRRS